MSLKPKLYSPNILFIVLLTQQMITIYNLNWILNFSLGIWWLLQQQIMKENWKKKLQLHFIIKYCLFPYNALCGVIARYIFSLGLILVLSEFKIKCRYERWNCGSFLFILWTVNWYFRFVFPVESYLFKSFLLQKVYKDAVKLMCFSYI